MAALLWNNTTANFILATAWDTGTTPKDADEVYFGSGTQGVTTGLSQSTLELDEFNIGEAYTGSIASSGAKLEIDATVLRWRSKGGHGFFDGIYGTVVVTGQGDSTMLELDGTITTVYVFQASGTITITGGAALTNIYMYDSPGCTIVIGTGVTALALIQMDSGYITCDSACTTMNIDGGRLLHTTGAITTLNLRQSRYGGGTFVHKASGTITTLNVLAPLAVFDGRTNIYKKPVTITNSTMLDGNVFLDNGMNSYTLTNAMTRFGGRLDLERGRGVNT